MRGQDDRAHGEDDAQGGHDCTDLQVYPGTQSLDRPATDTRRPTQALEGLGHALRGSGQRDLTRTLAGFGRVGLGLQHTSVKYACGRARQDEPGIFITPCAI